MNLENYFISQFKNKHIGDDAAVIGNYVYSKDAFFENVHFKLDWMSYYQVASKAMLVNLSDAIAMNSVPKYALLSVAMPKTISKIQINELTNGFKDIADLYGVEIIGGDTISNTKLDITVTIISQTDNVLKRYGMKKNHIVAYTGRLGDSYKDLKRLSNLGSIHKKSKFVNIKLRDKFIKQNTKYLSSGMDISDGLFSDLDKLSSINGLGFKFIKKIPKYIACSGEEYEMLVSFDKRYKKTILRRAKQTRTPLNIVAVADRNRYTNKCKAHHF